MKVEFSALIKSFTSKALVSLDKGYEVKVWGENPQMMKLVDAPADREVRVLVEWDETA